MPFYSAMMMVMMTIIMMILIIVIIIMSFIIDYFWLVPCLLLTRVVVLVGLHVVHLAWVMFTFRLGLVYFCPGPCLLLAWFLLTVG